MSASPLYASFEFTPSDPRGLAMAGAMAAVDGDAFGMLYNPASPSLSKGISIDAAYAVPYGEKQLATTAVAASWASLPFDHDGTLSSAGERFAPNGYQERTVSIGYSRTLASSIHAGISISRMSLRIDGFPDRAATGVNAGLVAELRPGLMLGISSFNLNSPTIGASKIPVPRTTLAGLSYRFENGNLLTTDVQGNPDGPGRILTAGEFRLMPSIVVMMGAGTNPSVISAGARFGNGPVRATGAVSRNIDLGTTAAFGLEFKL
jgi:hypothetical protein